MIWLRLVRVVVRFFKRKTPLHQLIIVLLVTSLLYNIIVSLLYRKTIIYCDSLKETVSKIEANSALSNRDRIIDEFLRERLDEDYTLSSNDIYNLRRSIGL